jgi:hypothetical protein
MASFMKPLTSERELCKETIKTWDWAAMANPFTRVTFINIFYYKTNMPQTSIAIVTIQKLGDILAHDYRLQVCSFNKG